jgi:hypothetical protein
MAIKIGDNLNYAGVKPDFVRQQYATFEEMAAVRDNTMPPIYLAYCLEDKNFYKYDKDNEVDPVTGKFRLFQSGGGGGGTVDTEMSNSSTNAVQNKVIKAYVDGGDAALREYVDSKDIQISEMPEPTSEFVGKVVQYIGPDDDEYGFYFGYFYVCDEDEPGVYAWFNIQVQEGGGGGTIDTAMSDTSTNAVQNKVIKSYVDTTVNSAVSSTSDELRSYVDGRINESITSVLNTGY